MDHYDIHIDTRSFRLQNNENNEPENTSFLMREHDIYYLGHENGHEGIQAIRMIVDEYSRRYQIIRPAFISARIQSLGILPSTHIHLALEFS